MEGEDKESDDENAFVNKKVWQRIYVVIAGALMNLVLGFVIVLILVCLPNLFIDKSIFIVALLILTLH